MNFIKRHLTALTSVLLGVVATVLYGTVLSHILIFMEQHRLFRYSAYYIADELHQAGPAKLAGDFVAQFFYYPWLGAAVLGIIFALLFATVADGLRRLAGRADAITIGAGLVLPALFIARGGTIEVRIEPLIIALGGCAAFWIASLVAARFIRRRNAAPATSGAAIAAAATAAAIIAGSVAWCMIRSYNPMERTVVLIEEEYRAGDYDAVIARADDYLAEGGNVHVVPFFRNLALLRQGRLAEHAFDFPPLFGIKALYVPWDGHVLKREYGRYLYDAIGHVNEAQRIQSEAMTNFGETGRVLTDLTAYNIINGRDRVARRGIRHLRQTLFYRHAADSLEAALGTGRVAGRADFFAGLPDSLNHFSFGELLPLLGYMNRIRPGDPALQELFMVGALLKGDLNNFMSGLVKFGITDPKTMPGVYREALAMVQAHDPEGRWRESGIPPVAEDVERYGRFFKAVQSGDRLQLRSGFGATYWYYFNFINPDRPDKQ